MKTEKSILPWISITFVVLAGAFISALTQNSYAISANELCERPNFKLWKQQQMNRMWEPTAETRLAEKKGIVFSYNCFTTDEIDQFFEAHGDRVENAHFIPILESRNHAIENDEDDSGECD